jgi:hypothetical protein
MMNLVTSKQNLVEQYHKLAMTTHILHDASTNVIKYTELQKYLEGQKLQIKNCSRVLLKKLTVTQPVKKFSAFHGT